MDLPRVRTLLSRSLSAPDPQELLEPTCPQTQPPAGLGLLFISAQELNEEGGELFDGAFKCLAREQGTQDRVPANARVEFR
jgi:hypothetical protein